MATNTDLVQQLYVAYYNRPADVAGLNYWVAALDGGATIDQVSKSFNTAPEYTALFAGKTADSIVDTVYQNLFGRHAETAGLNYWGPKVASGAISTADLVKQFLAGAVNADGTPNADGVAFANKVTVAEAFTTEIGTPGNEAERLAYSNATPATLATIKAYLAGVNTDPATLAAALANVHAVAVSAIPAAPVTVASLTGGIDTLTGGAGNDTFNAVDVTGSPSVLGGLDVIDGAGGSNILNVSDSLTLTGAAWSLHGATLKNIQTLNVSTSGGLAGLDLSGVSGLANVTLAATGASASTGVVLGSGVTATIATTAGNIGVAGGSNVTATTTGTNTVALSGASLSVATVNAGTGAVSIAGNGLTSVTVNGGDLSGAAAINNNTKTTLTNVTVTGSDTNVNIVGNGVTNVSVAGATTASRTVTVGNATANHALKFTAAGTGYDANGNEFATALTDLAATSLTVNTTAASSINAVTSNVLTSVVLTGSGALKFAPTSNSVLSIDGSAATGNLNLGSVNANAVTVKTGSGNDTLTINATALTTVSTGDGNDTVTLGSSLAAGSTINLGAGNDKLLGVAAQAPAAGTGTVIDGGAGIDTISADLINAGNAAIFKNFENLSLNSATGLDLALLTGNTITALTMDTTTTTATYQHVTATGLTDTFVGDNSAFTNTLSLSGVTGAADSFGITFAAVSSSTPVAANVKAGTIAAAGIETFNIVSGGTKAWNAVTLGADANAGSVVVTGASNLDLSFAAGFGDSTNFTGVSTIDGSAATGNLTISTLNVSSAGLTVKTGSGADVITITGKATVLAGAGNDLITVGTGASTITGGSGVTTVDAHLAVAGASFASAPVITTVTDAKALDVIKYAGAGATEAFTTTKINVSSATALSGGTVNALDLAAAATTGATAGVVTWFQYAGDTYIVEDNSNAATLTAADVVIKLTGLHDLSTSVAGAHQLTLSA